MTATTDQRTTAIVPRDRTLEHCLNSRSSVLVLEAPAGYGKTIVLSQWESADPRPFRWIRADWRHNDPAFLLLSLVDALGAIGPLPDEITAPLLAPPPHLELATARLRDSVAALSRPFVLVIDDVHRVSSPESSRVLTRVLEVVPEGSACAMASRTVTTMPLGRLRAERKLTELGPPELALSLEEADRLLQGSGRDLDRDQVRRLHARTEGWAAGLYLATLTLGRSEDVELGVTEFCGDDRLIADYLREEFLSELAETDLDFLTRSSVLDRLTGEACDAILERFDSAAVLRRLASSNMLITPLDAHGSEYRCHSLLREMLETELDLLDPRERRALHARASRWYLAADDFDRAVSHAIAAGDVSLTGDLILALAPEYEATGRGATLRTWLSEFSDRELRTSAPLCLARATTSATLGDGAQVEEWTSCALTAIDADGAESAAEMRAVASLLQAAVAARTTLARMSEDARPAKELLAPEDRWRTVCSFIEGVSEHLTGHPDAARAALEQGVRHGIAVGPNMACLCLAQLALLELDQDDPVAAGAAALRAIEIIERVGLEKDPTQALSFAVAALIHSRGGRTEAAAREARVAEALLDACNEISPWYEAEVRIVLARALILLDEVSGARAKLGEAGRHLRRVEDAHVLREWLRRAWEDADAARAVSGRWPLTPAELRLLHHLPTHHSFREIAEELYVSTNTVKTQARSIYRKLGVSSRAEAVACAEAAGLLADDEPRV